MLASLLILLPGIKSDINCPLADRRTHIHTHAHTNTNTYPYCCMSSSAEEEEEEGPEAE